MSAEPLTREERDLLIATWGLTPGSSDVRWEATVQRVEATLGNEVERSVAAEERAERLRAFATLVLETCPVTSSKSMDYLRWTEMVVPAALDALAADDAARGDQ